MTAWRGDDPTVAGTVPTTPPPTDGSCRLPLADLSGRSGAVDLGTAGACGALGATIQGVNPRDDLAVIDWARSTRICQRHPAAGDVDVRVVTTQTSIDLDDGPGGALARSPEEAEVDPIVAIELTFDERATPQTGPLPLIVCRTSTAELSIVHRPSP